MCFVSVFVRTLKLRGWGTVNKPLPTNWSDREKVYSELSVSLGQVPIFQMGVRQGENKDILTLTKSFSTLTEIEVFFIPFPALVSSGSDEQVGSTSRSTVRGGRERRGLEEEDVE